MKKAIAILLGLFLAGTVTGANPATQNGPRALNATGGDTVPVYLLGYDPVSNTFVTLSVTNNGTGNIALEVNLATSAASPLTTTPAPSSTNAVVPHIEINNAGKLAPRSGSIFTDSSSVKHNAAYAMVVGPSASTSMVTYTLAIGASGGVTATIEAGTQNAYVRLDKVASGSTDYAGVSNVSATLAGTGGGGRVFNDGFYPLILDGNGAARTMYFASSFNGAMSITIWKTLY